MSADLNFPEPAGYFTTTDDGRWVEAPEGADRSRLTPLYGQSALHAMKAEIAPIAAVLALDVEGRPGVCGQTIGADGSGQFAYVIRGTVEQADRWAIDHIRQREKAGQRIVSCVLVFSDEGYSGPMLKEIDSARAAGDGEGKR
jgi:hypothetical protein